MSPSTMGLTAHSTWKYPVPQGKEPPQLDATKKKKKSNIISFIN